MPVLTIQELKNKWVNGFIPDQNDYVDLFDTIDSIRSTNNSGSNPSFYDEGTFKPFFYTSGGGRDTYNLGQDGAYYVIDDMCYWNIRATIQNPPAGSSSGLFNIYGFPFRGVDPIVGDFRGLVKIDRFSGMGRSFVDLTCVMEESDDPLVQFQIKGTATSDYTTLANITLGNQTGASLVWLSGIYRCTQETPSQSLVISSLEE